MAVRIKVLYEGELHCTAVHGPSGDRIVTDAPTDNQGKGEHFSPTDLVAASLGTCALTIMGIAARTHGIEMRGATAEVLKEMGAVPCRHIARVTIRITLPARLDARERAILEAAAQGCPVHASLGPQSVVETSFVYV